MLKAAITDLGVEEVGLPLAVERDGLVSLVDSSHPGQPLAFLGSKQMAIATARAILTTLGERVETRPDRSGLDNLGLPRWLVVRNDTIVYKHGPVALLDSLLANLKSGPAGGAIYELQAWVEPEPAERKVVRVL